MRRYRPLAALCAIALGSLALTACGDDDTESSGGTGSGTTSTQSANAPKGEPIKVGMVCTCSGPQGSANSLSKEMAEAWVQWVNDNGGLNGHPVEVIVKDDGGDPARSARAVRELVEGDKVMAIAGENSLVDTAWQKYVEDKNFPVVGGVAYQPTMFASPVFFPSGASLLAETYGYLDAAKKANVTKFGTFYCAEAPACAQVVPLIKGIGSQLVGGIGLAHSAKVAATAPSYTAQCLAAKDAGVEAIFTAVSPAIGTRIIEQCKQQGFEPKFVGISGALPVSAAASGDYDGAILAQGNLPPTSTDTPGGKQLAEAIERYAPGITDNENWNANPTHTWAGLQLFAKAAEASKLGPTAKPSDVMAAMYKLKDETIDGLSGPLNYVKGQPTLAACPFIETVKNGEWVSVDGSEPECVPEDKIKGLAQIAQAAAG